MRRPEFDMSIFKERRSQLAALCKGAAVILPSHPDYIRNHDVHHPFRQDSNLFYLTGFEEPESILVFRPGQTPETVMFVRPKDPFRETWDGFRYGPQGAENEFKMDKAYLIGDFEKVIGDLLRPVDRIYYRWNIDPEFDTKMLSILNTVRLSQGRTGKGHLSVFDSWELIGEMRLRKTPYEFKMLHKAGEISAKGHIEAMKFARPGVNERQVHATVIHSFMMEGARREGYNTIVAGGNNATTLHYVFNDCTLKDGDLLLVDAGAEYQYYTGDITRTYPVNGKFTKAQAQVYERVLELQKSLIQKVKPGLVFKSMQDMTIDYLTEVMLDLKLLRGKKSDIIEKQEFKKYYPHGVSHWLGMDVHDVGLHMVSGEPRQLEPGMCFTIEPGIYIPEDDMTAPQELRGIGIRIEDNILVTPTGCEVTTTAAPKEIADMEAIIGKR